MICTIILQNTKQTSRLLQNTRVAVQKCTISKVLLNILQNPDEISMLETLKNKVAVLRHATLLKMTLCSRRLAMQVFTVK